MGTCVTYGTVPRASLQVASILSTLVPIPCVCVCVCDLSLFWNTGTHIRTHMHTHTRNTLDDVSLGVDADPAVSFPSGCDEYFRGYKHSIATIRISAVYVEAALSYDKNSKILNPWISNPCTWTVPPSRLKKDSSWWQNEETDVVV